MNPYGYQQPYGAQQQPYMYGASYGQQGHGQVGQSQQVFQAYQGGMSYPQQMQQQQMQQQHMQQQQMQQQMQQQHMQQQQMQRHQMQQQQMQQQAWAMQAGAGALGGMHGTMHTGMHGHTMQPMPQAQPPQPTQSPPPQHPSMQYFVGNQGQTAQQLQPQQNPVLPPSQPSATPQPAPPLPDEPPPLPDGPPPLPADPPPLPSSTQPVATYPPTPQQPQAGYQQPDAYPQQQQQQQAWAQHMGMQGAPHPGMIAYSHQHTHPYPGMSYMPPYHTSAYTAGMPAMQQPGYAPHPHMQGQQQLQQPYGQGQQANGHHPHTATPQTAPTPGSATAPPQGAPPTENQSAHAQSDMVAAGVAEAKKRLAALQQVVDAVSLMRRPGRLSRPPKMLMVLRGLPGSGRSHLARRLREVEVEEGGEAPRVHSLDDYFMTEVEKEEEEHGSKGKGRKRKIMVMEYEYDPDMEAAYCKALSKAVEKTMGEGRFRFVVMDAPNVRLADFMDVLAAAQRLGYEAFVCKPLEADPALCAKRNIHGRTLEQIKALAAVWEEAPATLTLLDAAPLLSGRVVAGGAIKEVEMGADEGEEGGDRRDGAGAAVWEEGASAALLSKSRWLSDGGDEEDKGDRGDNKGTGQGGHQDRGGKKGGRAGSATSANGSTGISDADILAGINDALQKLDEEEEAGEGGTARGGSGSGGLKKKRGLGELGGVSEVEALVARARRRLRKRVWWADQGPQQEEGGPQEGEEEGGGEGVGGFMMQTPTRPLCEVRVLDGLGPAPGDTALQYMDASSPLMAARGGRCTSFADQVRAEHSSEHTALAHTHLSDQQAAGEDE